MHDHCVHSNFVLTYLKQFFKTKTRHKTLSIALKVIKSVYIALSRQRWNTWQIFLTNFSYKICNQGLIDFINSIHLIKEPFKKDVTAKIAIFGPPSPHVTIDTISGHPLPSSHRVNSDKLSLGIQVTKTIWDHFKNSNDTSNGKSAKFLKQINKSHNIVAGRISTSNCICSVVLILDVDTECFDFFQKEMCFSDVSIHLHVSTQLFSPELVFPHQVYF